MAVIDRLYWLDKKVMGSDLLQKIKKRLHCESFDSGDYEYETKKFDVYEEYEDRIGVPRSYGLDNFGTDNIVDNTVTGERVKYSFRGDLREEQIPWVRDCVAGILKNGYGAIGQAVCAFGKTVAGVKIIEEIGLKTIIIVPNEVLMDQWTEAVEEFLGESVGIVRQKKCQYKEHNICVATVQSLATRDYGKEFYESFGLVIFDEVHRASAPTWHTTIAQFPARYKFGTTATPRRGDGLQKIFFWHIGKIVAEYKEYSLKGDAYQIRFEVIFNENDFKQVSGRLNLDALRNALANNYYRNDMIALEVTRAVASGRNMIVIGDRTKQLDKIKELALKRNPNITFGITYGSKIKKADLKKAKQAQVILGTFKKIEVGFNVPRVDTLFLASPKSDVEQIVGRILRDYIGKKDPLVVDVVDTSPTLLKFAERRQKCYRKMNLTIHRVGAT